MNREEHIQWAKNRAYELLEQKEPRLALASFISDMTKEKDTMHHPMLNPHNVAAISILGVLHSELDHTCIKHWINGF